MFSFDSFLLTNHLLGNHKYFVFSSCRVLRKPKLYLYILMKLPHRLIKFLHWFVSRLIKLGFINDCFGNFFSQKLNSLKDIIFSALSRNCLFAKDLVKRFLHTKVADFSVCRCNYSEHLNMLNSLAIF